MKNFVNILFGLFLFISCKVFISDEDESVFLVPPNSSQEEIIGLAVEVKPTTRQYDWQKKELAALIHFGINTFKESELNDGSDDPSIFNPDAMNVSQWTSIMRNAGFQRIILTVKYHDGFCLWPSQWTDYTIANSPYKNGTGDIVKELSDECKKANLDFGIYISPWDRHEATYGTEAYNDFFRNQLEELLTQYGNISEVWLDGANGEGPGGKQQIYDWESYYNQIRKFQPTAIISIKGPDVRWVGTENGFGRETEWSVIPVHLSTSLQNQVPDQQLVFPATDVNTMELDLGSRQKLVGATHLVWYPSEVNVSVRPGWFFQEDQNDQVKNSQNILDIYFGSVGRNSSLLLNVPPDKRGLIHELDAVSLIGFKSAYDQIFSQNKAFGATIETTSLALKFQKESLLDGNLDTYWKPRDEDDTPTITLSFDGPKTFNIISLQEPIFMGQRIERFLVEYWLDDKWDRLTQGTTVGYKRLLRTETVTTEHLRILFTESRATPMIAELGVFKNLPEVTFDPKGVAFTERIRVNLIPDDTSSQIFYTVDGSVPTQNSQLYDIPLILKASTQISAVSILPNGVAGYVNTQLYNKAEYKVLLNNAPHIRFTAGGSLILTDGIYGGNQFDNNRWLGFLEDDLIAIVDLDSIVSINNILLNFLNNPIEKIYLPLNITYYTSNTLKRWRKLTTTKVNSDLGSDVFSHTISKQLKNTKARYIKIVAENAGVVPTGQIGEGEKSWIFIDEISVDTP